MGLNTQGGIENVYHVDYAQVLHGKRGLLGYELSFGKKKKGKMKRECLFMLHTSHCSPVHPVARCSFHFPGTKAKGPV